MDAPPEPTLPPPRSARARHALTSAARARVAHVKAVAAEITARDADAAAASHASLHKVIAANALAIRRGTARRAAAAAAAHSARESERATLEAAGLEPLEVWRRRDVVTARMAAAAAQQTRIRSHADAVLAALRAEEDAAAAAAAAEAAAASATAAAADRLLPRHRVDAAEEFVRARARGGGGRRRSLDPTQTARVLLPAALTTLRPAGFGTGRLRARLADAVTAASIVSPDAVLAVSAAAHVEAACARAAVGAAALAGPPALLTSGSGGGEAGGGTRARLAIGGGGGEAGALTWGALGAAIATAAGDGSNTSPSRGGGEGTVPPAFLSPSTPWPLLWRGGGGGMNPDALTDAVIDAVAARPRNRDVRPSPALLRRQTPQPPLPAPPQLRQQADGACAGGDEAHAALRGSSAAAPLARALSVYERGMLARALGAQLARARSELTEGRNESTGALPATPTPPIAVPASHGLVAAPPTLVASPAAIEFVDCIPPAPDVAVVADGAGAAAPHASRSYVARARVTNVSGRPVGVRVTALPLAVADCVQLAYRPPPHGRLSPGAALDLTLTYTPRALLSGAPQRSSGDVAHGGGEGEEDADADADAAIAAADRASTLWAAALNPRAPTLRGLTSHLLDAAFELLVTPEVGPLLRVPVTLSAAVAAPVLAAVGAADARTLARLQPLQPWQTRAGSDSVPTLREGAGGGGKALTRALAALAARGSPLTLTATPAPHQHADSAGTTVTDEIDALIVAASYSGAAPVVGDGCVWGIRVENRGALPFVASFTLAAGSADGADDCSSGSGGAGGNDTGLSTILLPEPVMAAPFSATVVTVTGAPTVAGRLRVPVRASFSLAAGGPAGLPGDAADIAAARALCPLQRPLLLPWDLSLEADVRPPPLSLAEAVTGAAEPLQLELGACPLGGVAAGSLTITNTATHGLRCTPWFTPAAAAALASLAASHAGATVSVAFKPATAVVPGAGTHGDAAGRFTFAVSLALTAAAVPDAQRTTVCRGEAVRERESAAISSLLKTLAPFACSVPSGDDAPHAPIPRLRLPCEVTSTGQTARLPFAVTVTPTPARATLTADALDAGVLPWGFTLATPFTLCNPSGVPVRARLRLPVALTRLAEARVSPTDLAGSGRAGGPHTGGADPGGLVLAPWASVDGCLTLRLRARPLGSDSAPEGCGGACSFLLWLEQDGVIGGGVIPVPLTARIPPSPPLLHAAVDETTPLGATLRCGAGMRAGQRLVWAACTPVPCAGGDPTAGPTHARAAVMSAVSGGGRASSSRASAVFPHTGWLSAGDSIGVRVVLAEAAEEPSPAAAGATTGWRLVILSRVLPPPAAGTTHAPGVSIGEGYLEPFPGAQGGALGPLVTAVAGLAESEREAVVMAAVGSGEVGVTVVEVRGWMVMST